MNANYFKLVQLKRSSSRFTCNCEWHIKELYFNRRIREKVIVKLVMQISTVNGSNNTRQNYANYFDDKKG